jgi:hypothetical protein
VTKVDVIDGWLAVDIQGWDKLWAMTSRLEIPLEHVVDVRPADDDPVEGFRVLGTYLPGLITAGTFLQEGNRVFWNVRNRANAVTVDLRGEDYARLIVEVADPAETISAVKNALFRSRFQRA